MWCDYIANAVAAAQLPDAASPGTVSMLPRLAALQVRSAVCTAMNEVRFGIAVAAATH